MPQWKSFWKLKTMNIEHELSFSAIFFWLKSCWEGKWSNDKHQAWERRISEAGSWNKVHGPAGAACRALIDADIQLSVWDVLLVDGRMLDCRMIAPSGVEEHFIKKKKVKLRWLKI